MMHGSEVGTLLLSAAAGYWVLERADKRRGSLKKVGQIVGWAIIASSLIGTACKIYALAMGSWGYCPPHKMMSCPFSSKASPPASQP